MMAAAIDHGPEVNTLYIGEGVVIKGAVVAADTVVVAGTLEGDITVEHLIVSAAGTISGRISVTRNAEIFGRVFEKLDVKGLLVLRAGGRVEGNMSFGTLTLERGANVTGNVSSTDYRTNQQSSYRAQQPAPSFRPEQRNAPPAAPAPSVATVTPLDLSLDWMPGPISATG